MERKIFCCDEVTMHSLLIANVQDFSEGFNDYYFLNPLALKVFLRIYNHLYELKELIINCAIKKEDYKLVIALLINRFGKQNTQSFLIDIKRFDILANFENYDFFIEDWASEIGKANMEQSNLNDVLYRKGKFSILAKLGDWKTFAYFDNAEVLQEYGCWKEMVYGGKKCLDAIFASPEKDKYIPEIVARAFAEDFVLIDGERFSCANYLIHRGGIPLLAQGDNWKLLQKRRSFIVYSSFLIEILQLDEERKIFREELWCELIKNCQEELEIRSDEPDRAALYIWIYKNAIKTDAIFSCRFLLKQYPFWSKTRWRMQSLKWDGLSFKEIKDKLK